LQDQEKIEEIVTVIKDLVAEFPQEEASVCKVQLGYSAAYDPEPYWNLLSQLVRPTFGMAQQHSKN
jgi:hypothetical protein